MNEEIEMMLSEARSSMDRALDHLQKELGKIRAGKANPSMLTSVMVEAYGIQSPINQLASITTPDARTLSIQPFDKSTLQSIEKGILQANIGEEAKISLRSGIKEALDYVKSLEKDGLSEDLAKDAEAEVQKVIVEYTSKIEAILSSKEVEIMTV